VSTERAVCIEPDGRRLIGILHQPAAARAATPAVVVVVGGPQYRIGSHRQFVLLGRELCRRGTPVLRFDIAGMGDSGGEFDGFEFAGRDIRAAIDELQLHDPGMRGVCLWGLCDGASAALMYAHEDPRVTHLVLLNPWVRTSEGQAQAYLDSYYGRKLRSPGFWRKMLGNPASIVRAASGFLSNLHTARRAPAATDVHGGVRSQFLPMMLSGARSFTGRTLVLLSGQDLVATEFELLLDRSDAWRDAFRSPSVLTRKLPEATHTFSRRVWRDWAAAATAEFIAR
jgi:uncharacterized protein